MGLADRVAKAEAGRGGGGTYWLEGKYVVRIDAVKRVHNEHRNVEFFIVEGTAAYSTNARRDVGSQNSWVCNTSTFAAPRDIKQFIAAALNVDDSEITGEAAEAVWSAANPLQDSFVGLEVVEVEMKQAPVDPTTGKRPVFSRHIWTPLAEEKKERYRQALADVDIPF